MGPHLWHVMVLCSNSTNTILIMCQTGVKGRNSCWNERTSAFNHSEWKERRDKPGEKRAGKPLWCLLSAPRGHWLTGPFDRTAHTNFRMSVFSQEQCPGSVSSHRVFGGIYTVLRGIRALFGLPPTAQSCHSRQEHQKDQVKPVIILQFHIVHAGPSPALSVKQQYP